MNEIWFTETPTRRACSRVWRRRSGLRTVGEVDDAVVVRLTGGERQLAGRGVLGKEPRAGTARQRIDEEMQLVDEAVCEHRPHERAAAADVEVAVELGLQRANPVRVVRP